MKYRDIAKQFIWTRGFQTAFVAEDGLDYNDSKRAFTDGQLEKCEAARQAVKASLGKKWAIDKKTLKDVPRPTPAAGD